MSNWWSDHEDDFDPLAEVDPVLDEQTLEHRREYLEENFSDDELAGIDLDDEGEVARFFDENS